MRLLREVQTSFARGVNDSAAPDEYSPDQAQVMINGRPSFQGNAVERMAGQYELSSPTNWTSVDGSTCYGAIEFYTAAGAQQIVAAFDDAMYVSTDGGSTFSAIAGATSLTEEYWGFAIIREGAANVLCCVNGGTNSYQYDGTTWATISNIPANTKYLAVMGNRLIAAGGSGVTVAASKVSDIDNGYGSSAGGWTVVASTNDGDTEIKGLFVLGSVLLVFKRKSVGYIEGFGYQTLQVETGSRGISRSVGCIAHRSIAPAGDQAVMWLSERGFEYYAIGSVIQLASAYQQRFVGKIARSAVHQHEGLPSAIWLASRREYWCALPVANGVGTALSATRNTWTYIFRPQTGERPPAAYMRYPTTLASSSFAVGSDGMLDISEADQTGYMGFVDGHGMLDICKLPDPGLWATVDGSGMLDVFNPTSGASSLFTADAGNRPGWPFAGTHANTVVELERDPDTVNLVQNGDFSSSLYWRVGLGWSIAAGVLSGPGPGAGVPQGNSWQLIPIVAGGSYEVTFTVANRTQNGIQPYLGGTAGTNRTTNGTFTETIVAGSTDSYLLFDLTGSESGTWDGDIDNVSVVPLGMQSLNRLLLRTRPLTFGDEFTRKKAKRMTVLAKQALAHNADVYVLADLSYGTGHSVAFTAADAAQERRERMNGKGRILQAEVHVSADSLIDAIEMVAQPLGDQI